MSKKIQKIIGISPPATLRKRSVAMRAGVCFAFCFASVLCLLPGEVKAASASLYLSPPSGTYAIEGIFSIKVKVNSNGEDINAAEGTLIFNPDEVQVKSISKTGSIFNLWTTEPAFSNSTGNISFGGGTTTNFTGASGTIIAINFKAKSASSAQINFSSGSVLMADGKGTNILSSMNGGVYTLKPKIVMPSSPILPTSPTSPTMPTVPSNAPTAPNISSLTHLDSEKWYSNNEPKFTWKISKDITGTKLLVGHQPIVAPNVYYSEPIAEKQLDGLADGVWYFHAQLRNKFGWGAISHFKFQIDTELPEPFEVRVDNQGDFTDPTPILYFETSDSLSGIEYYEVKIGEKEKDIVFVGSVKNNSYKTPLLIAGEHNVIVKAFDKAGNFSTAVTEITIEPISAPIITDFLETIDTGDSLIIKGTSLYPESEITIFTKKQGEEAIANNIKTDNKGDWSYTHSKTLEKGIYQAWAYITDERGARSNLTDKVTISVVLPVILEFGETAINYLSIIIVLASLIMTLMGIIFYGFQKVVRMRRRLRKETQEVGKSVAGAFKALQEEVKEQVEYLDGKKGVTKTEKQVQRKLKKALNISQKVISKEIQDIENLLK